MNETQSGKGAEFIKSLLADRFLQCVFVAQVGLLFLVARQNMDALNTDGIAYMQIAQHWADGNRDLAVSGYWGPLLSWLMVPLVESGMPLMEAARVVMGFSGGLFFLSVALLFKVMNLSQRDFRCGLVITAAMGVFWSIRNVTPDLLLTALTSLGLSGLLMLFRTGSRYWLVFGSVSWAMAYMTKAVALPWLVLTLVAAGVVAWWYKRDLRETGLQSGKVLGLVILLCAPWMVVLSSHYGQFVFSTSGKINHSIAGPSDVERYHPFARTFHEPETGRVSSWEDPDIDEYAHWSPFDGAEEMKHQIGLVMSNVPKVLILFCGVNFSVLLRSGGELGPGDLPALIPGFDLLYVALAALVLSALGAWKRKGEWDESVLLVSLLGLVGMYLPMFLLPYEQRYFYPVFPIVWILFSKQLSRLLESEKLNEKKRFLIQRFAIGSWGLPTLIWLMAAMVGIPNVASFHAQRLAGAMEDAGLEGRVAGSARVQGGRAGMYAAFLIGQPWCGDQLYAGPDSFAESPADWVVVIRGTDRDLALSNSPMWISIDPMLLSKEWNPEEELLKVYGRRAQASPR